MGVANGINLVNGVSSLCAVVDGPLFKIPHCFRPLSAAEEEEGKVPRGVSQTEVFSQSLSVGSAVRGGETERETYNGT